MRLQKMEQEKWAAQAKKEQEMQRARLEVTPKPQTLNPKP